MVVPKSPERKLLGAPVQLKDAPIARDDMSSKYWELFLDLLLVVASSAIADDLQKDVSWRGVKEFMILYLTMIHGYTLYTPTLTTRFEDSSLYHAVLLLFPYVMGILWSALHSSLVTVRAFCLGAFVQRIVMVVLLDGISDHIPKARVWSTHVRILTLLNAVFLGAAMLFPTSYGQSILMTVALVEFVQVLVQADWIPPQHQLPIDVPHTRSRLTSIVLVTLGESVVTNMIRFQTSVANVQHWSNYSWTMGLTLIMVFSLMLLYVQMIPSLKYDATNRSTLAETVLFAAHKLLGMTLLGVGVGVRLMMEAARTNSQLTPNDAILLSISVGGSMLLFLAIRLVHYQKPTADNTAPADVVFLKDLWWNSFFVAVAVPFQLLFANIQDPVQSAAIYAFLLAAYCVIECSFTQVLGKFLPSDTASDDDDDDTDNELFNQPKDTRGLSKWLEEQLDENQALTQWLLIGKAYLLGLFSHFVDWLNDDNNNNNHNNSSATNAGTTVARPPRRRRFSVMTSRTEHMEEATAAEERRRLRRERRRQRTRDTATASTTTSMTASLPSPPRRTKDTRPVSAVLESSVGGGGGGVPKMVTTTTTTTETAVAPPTAMNTIGLTAEQVIMAAAAAAASKPAALETNSTSPSSASSTTPSSSSSSRKKSNPGRKPSRKSKLSSSRGSRSSNNNNNNKNRLSIHTPRSQREQVYELVKVLDPSQAENVDLLLLQFSGREDELIESLQQMQQQQQAEEITAKAAAAAPVRASA